jgi:hypothetical protein
MIVAGRIDRRIAPPGPAGLGTPEPAAQPQPGHERIEEHDE